MSHLKDVFAFVIGTVLFKYIIVQWFADQVGHLLHWLFVRTERDAIVWTHYQKHVLKQGHQPKTPVVCNDEKCSEV